MTKLERKAYKALPDETLGDGYTHTHKREREAYIEGYKQAIEDACEWLQENCVYTHPRKGSKECIVNIPRFKNDLIIIA